MVELVDQMLELNQQLATARTPQARDVLQRHIEVTDKEIDHLVYELYGLTNRNRPGGKRHLKGL